MSCGCKKKGEELRVVNVTLVEVTPEPTPQEIKIETNGEDIKETSTYGDSE